MDEVVFDKFADECDTVACYQHLSIWRRPEFFAKYKIKNIAREYVLRLNLSSSPLSILGFGAGNGGAVPYVKKHFPNAWLTCLFESQRSLEVAEK